MTKYKYIYLLLGSNMGDRAAYLDQARSRIQGQCGAILKESATYATKAWGIETQPDFYNQVLEIDSDLQPLQLLTTILEIEQEMGRVRKGKWLSRVIDIDILFYDDLVLDLPNLQIPHPKIPERNFTLVPLMEIAPGLKHPSLGFTVRELYLQSLDTLDVLMIER